MKPWEILARARTADGGELTLTRHDTEYVIKSRGQTLMSSREHESEEALATIGCRYARLLPRPKVLVGGLGIGYTLRAALDVLPPTATVVVAEIVPEIVEWNRGPLATFAGHPLDDRRVRVEIADVAAVMRSHPAGFDAVLLDVDNGPTALTVAANISLYDVRGIALTRAALIPGGVLAVWTAEESPAFARRLKAAAFSVERVRVTSRPGKRGTRHMILVARVST